MKGSHLSARHPDRESGDAKEGGSCDQHVKDKGTGMHSQLYLGGVEQSSIQAQGYRGRGDIQGDEAFEGKFLRVCGDSGGVVLEGTHEEVEW